MFTPLSYLEDIHQGTSIQCKMTTNGCLDRVKISCYALISRNVKLHLVKMSQFTIWERTQSVYID